MTQSEALLNKIQSTMWDSETQESVIYDIVIYIKSLEIRVNFLQTEIKQLRLNYESHGNNS